MLKLTDEQCHALEMYILTDGDFVCCYCNEPFGTSDDTDTTDEYDCVIDRGRLFHNGCFDDLGG